MPYCLFCLPARLAGALRLSLAFFGVLVFRGVSRAFPFRIASFPVMAAYLIACRLRGGVLVQAGRGQPQVEGELAAVPGRAGAACGQGCLGRVMPGEVPDHGRRVGQQVHQLVDVVGLEQDALVGEGDRVPRDGIPPGVERPAG